MPSGRRETMEDAMNVLALGEESDLSAPEVRHEALETLESGGLILLPKIGFELTPREADILSDVKNILVRPAETANGRPTIIFDPSRRRIRKLNFVFAGGRPVRARIQKSALPDLEEMMARYARWSEEIVARLLPRYQGALEGDRVTYRPNRRDAVQPLHVDSAYGDPTGGRGMLRVFCNVDPLQHPRTWQVGEPFESFAARFFPSMRLATSDWKSALLARLGLLGGARSAYDSMIAELRRLGKRDEEYQRTAPRRIVEFPSGSTWLAITDLVLHGAISGQHSLDRTFFLPPEAMRQPS